jgi:hypothetical protein
LRNETNTGDESQNQTGRSDFKMAIRLSELNSLRHGSGSPLGDCRGSLRIKQAAAHSFA